MATDPAAENAGARSAKPPRGVNRSAGRSRQFEISAALVVVLIAATLLIGGFIGFERLDSALIR